MRAADTAAVGYEFETTRADSPLEVGWLDRRLAARWERAEERLMSAMRAYAVVRRESRPGEAPWIEAQLRLAEARQRWRECADEAERLAECVDEFDPHG